jgi:anti-sigma regulatory factor (Ser/Thr protein kinase)
MRDISYHILDIVRNSISAGASKVEIEISENSCSGEYCLIIRDNGCGMEENTLNRVTDPFFTTSVTKKVGLGLPLLKQHTELARGSFTIESAIEKGTTVTAIFNRNHIDMIPAGDLALTFRTLLVSSQDLDLIFRYQLDGNGFELNTAIIRKELGGVGLTSREVLDYLCDFIRDNLKAAEGHKNRN